MPKGCYSIQIKTFQTRLFSILSNLIQFIRVRGLDPWIQINSKGGLRQPSTHLVQEIKKCEVLFQQFHGNDINREEKVIAKFNDILQKHQDSISLPLEILKKFSKVRTHIRIKMLKQKMKENSYRTPRSIKNVSRYCK